MLLSLMPLLLMAQASTIDCQELTIRAQHILADQGEAVCHTMRLHALASLAQAEKLEACFIEALQSEGISGHPFTGLGGQEPLVMHKDDHKEATNPFGGDATLFETENFAIWWGETTNFSESHISTLATHFETIWSVQIDELGYPPPEFSDSYKVNVFIGDTHPNLPSAEGNAGYFWYDPDGKPMLVLSQDIIAYPDSAKLTGAHEFFHAVQNAVNTYQFQGQAMWYLEATANWILEEVFTEEGGYSNTLYSVAMRPEIALNHFGDYATEGLEADHHYGAFIFATFLSEHIGGTAFVQNSFLSASVGADPLVVIDSLLQEQDTNMHETHLSYAMHNATWDYRFESDYELSVADAEHLGESHRIAGYLDGLSEEWTDQIPHPPHTYGANYWRITNLPEQFYVEFDGDAQAQWSVGLASQTGSVHTQRAIFQEKETAQVLVENWENTPQNWLVISAIDDVVDRGDTYSYQFRLRSIENVEREESNGAEEPDESGGFGCASVSSSVNIYFLLLSLVLLFRKKMLTT